ncbi:odorant receptor 94b-like [Anopheles marshallii]|uniref:odorant receptor 94b-like n=1 Tax=Anopheles marshallii TaxID=1521116 RepID=UPI00237A845F|nr:odorant receptor 94b-like [Anopheles marshallii]
MFVHVVKIAPIVAGNSARDTFILECSVLLVAWWVMRRLRLRFVTVDCYCSIMKKLGTSEGNLEFLFALISSHMNVLKLNILNPDWRLSVLPAIVFAMIGFLPFLTAYSVCKYYPILEIIVECLTQTCTGMQVLFRTYFYLCQRNVCRQIVREMREQRTAYGANQNDRMEQLFERATARMLCLYRLVYAMYCGSFFFLLSPLIIPDPRKSSLPLAFQLPFLPPDENLLYWCLNYLHHISLNIIGIHHLAPMDGVVLLALISISTRINALQLMLEELDGKIAESEWQQTEHLEPYLDRIIELHSDMKRFAELVKTTFQLHFFSIITMICLILCMCLNVIVIQPKNSIYPLMVASIVQLLVVCLFGNILLIANDRLPASIYGIQWYRLTVAQQKKILFLMANAQTDIEMSGVFMPVNMTSFVAVLRAAYSYFTILNRSAYMS